MRKEMVDYPIGRGKETVFHPSVKAYIKPSIVATFTQAGIRMYKDDAGREHVADTFDRVWGKTNPAAILPNAKRAYQRYFRK